jgi:hypothetical protein
LVDRLKLKNDKLFKKKIINKVGYTLNKVETRKQSLNYSSKDYLLFNFFTTIIKMGFSAKHIIDVGANHGSWTRDALRYFPDANFTLLEPQNWLKNYF